MGSFFDGISKIIQGKPVFDAPAGDTPQPSEPVPAAQSPSEKPLVTIERVEYYENGSEMTLNMHVRNHSRQPIHLHEIICFGKRRLLGLPVNPGDTREINEVYRGPLLADSGRRIVELDYKAQDGNMFRTVHRAEYQHKADRMFGVHEVRYEPPIRDI